MSLRTALAATLVLWPLGAQAQEGFEWLYNRQVGPSPFDTSLTLVYGLPQSDAVQFFARCAIGAGGPYAAITVGADVEGLPDGQTVRVQASGNGGPAQVYEGTVARWEEGIWGVDLALPLDAPLLTTIRDATVLRYGVVGRQPLTMSLRGSSRPTRDFLSDCAAIGDLQPAGMAGQAAPMAVPQVVQGHGCDLFPGLRSTPEGAAARIRFENRTDSYRVVTWLDYDGRPVDMGALDPGESLTIDTVLSHPWMMTDGPGNCVEIVRLQPGVTDYPLTVRALGFGPE